jgi:hypothetical protein
MHAYSQDYCKEGKEKRIKEKPRRKQSTELLPRRPSSSMAHFRQTLSTRLLRINPFTSPTPSNTQPSISGLSRRLPPIELLCSYTDLRHATKSSLSPTSTPRRVRQTAEPNSQSGVTRSWSQYRTLAMCRPTAQVGL